jgi:hypothetical protein
MSTVLNRTTRQLIVSANTPDYPLAQWIIEPNLSAVVGFGSKYWVITGDAVTLMSQAQRDAVDAADLAAARDAVVSALDAAEVIDRAVLLVILDELNAHALKINALLDAIDAAASLAALKTAVGAISDYPQRTVQQLRTAVRNKLGA